MPLNDKIGPMGYGVQEDPDNLNLLKDKVYINKLASETPMQFVRRAPKKGNDRVLSLVNDALQKDGFESGSMSLRYLSVPLFGECIKWSAQLIGSCVASGAMRAITYRTIAEILVFGDLEYMLGYEVTGMNSVAPFAPYHYGCGRRRGGLRGGDGSFCGAQIEALQKDGILMCSAPGLSRVVGTNARDYPETQDTRLYRQFGDWKYLDDFVEEARRIRLAESNVINYRNIEEDKEDCVVGLKPAMICSNWGFAPSYKHKDGFWVYKRSGQWAHNMTRSGYRVATDGNWFVEITNSWGPDAHRDGEHFYVPIEVFEQWMKQANAATIGELDLIDQSVPVL